MQCETCHTWNDCIEVISEVFKIYYKRPYDYLFNFQDPKTMSCVEFVWGCFKCLSPLHKVAEKQVSWFKDYGPLKVDVEVMIPDDFIRSEGFDLVYSSVDKGTKNLKREELLIHIDETINQSSFRRFHNNNLLWQAGLCGTALLLHFMLEPSKKATA